jgi:xanthosine utilization system XapX-like protein
MSKMKQDIMRKHFPKYDFEFTNDERPHKHLMLAFERRTVGLELVRRANNMCEGLQHVLIVGTSLRPAFYPKAWKLHGCDNGDTAAIRHKFACWEQDKSEFVTILKEGEKPGPFEQKYCVCKHGAQDCDCRVFGVAVSVHSLYDCDAETVARICLNTTKRTLFSIGHDFLDFCGTFAGDEASYYIRKDGKCVMQVVGNNEPYVTGTSRWMIGRRSLIVAVGGRKYELAWSRVGEHPFSTVRRFTVVEVGADAPVTDYCPDAIETPTSRHITATLGATVDYGFDAAFSGAVVNAGPKWLSVRVGGRWKHVNRAVLYRAQQYFQGRPITADAINNCRKTTASRVASLATEDPSLKNMPTAVVVDDMQSIDVTVGLALQAVLDSQADKVELFHPRMEAAVRRHNWLLENPFKRWSNAYLRLAVSVAISIVVATLFQLLPVRVVADAAMEVVRVVGVVLLTSHLAPIIGTLLTGVISWLVLAKYAAAEPLFAEPEMTPTDAWITELLAIMITVTLAWFIRRWTRTNPLVRARKRVRRWFNDCNTLLEAGVAEGPIDEGLSIYTYTSRVDVKKFPPREGAKFFDHKMKCKLPNECKPGAVPVAICFDCAAPLVADVNTANAVCAVKTRAILDSPDPELGFWESIYELMEGELPLEGDADGVNVIGRDRPKLLDLEEWMKTRYKTENRKELRRIQDALLKGEPFLAHYSAFLKREKVMKLNREKFVHFRIRLIQALNKMAKVAHFSWWCSYTTAMEQAWHKRHHIFYTCGATCDDINEWVEYWLSNYSRAIFISCDFGKYDTTQGVRCIELEHDHYRQLGFGKRKYGEKTLRAMMRATCFIDGICYSVSGTRKSGDMNTSSGNTRNGVYVIYSFFKHNFPAPCPAAMMSLGDDNLIFVNADVVSSHWGIDGNTLRRRLHDELLAWVTRAGFTLKVSVSWNLANAEYLSCRFYPTDDGYKIGKKPGRVLTKLGWMLARSGKYDYDAHMYGTLLSYLPTANHVPFLRVVVNRLLAEFKSEATAPIYDRDGYFRMKGQVWKADEFTWAAFFDTYGLTEGDEREFARHVDDCISKYGRRVLISSDAVDAMYRVDYGV